MGGLRQLKRGKSPLRLHGTIARDIGIGIVSGRLKPGQILTGEIDSSARLAVSRTAYREALRILAAKGLVESRPKVGTKVSEQRNWHLLDPDVVGWTFANEPDWVMLKNLFELRDIVESHAAALAAIRRSDAQLKRIIGKLDGLLESADGSRRPDSGSSERACSGQKRTAGKTHRTSRRVLPRWNFTFAVDKYRRRIYANRWPFEFPLIH